MDRVGENRAIALLKDILRGVAIGVAFIIPGFSGGSVAAILGVYDVLVGAIADIFKHFKRSVLTLLPYVAGILISVAALILPIRWGLEHYPVPTVSLFVGLALGGLPSVAGKMKGGVRPQHVLSLVLALALAAGLPFLPRLGEVDLYSLDFFGYLLLVPVGAVGSAALVVPGISGSMLLLIFGYYNPIVALVTEHLLRGNDVGKSILVLALLAAGIVIGFFAISVLMKFLLKKFPRGTYFSILGFIVGSVPAVYASVIRESGTAQLHDPLCLVAAGAFLLAGCALSLAFVLWARRRAKKRETGSEPRE